MTPDNLDQAIAWFGNRRPQMPGARKNSQGGWRDE
nr:MAG TPA: hypothetical protein [Caudoviricetes sp.]